MTFASTLSHRLCFLTASVLEMAGDATEAAAAAMIAKAV